MCVSCSLNPAKPSSDFKTYDKDERVVYETGAEGFAELVADAMPAALRAVEAAHNKPFVQSPTVLLTASEENFIRLTGHDVEAVSLPSGVYLSPYLLRYPKRISGVLAHELSHLHLRQHVGSLKLGRLPLWFVEGLATLAASGGGAANVSDEEATRALQSGNYTKPAYKRGLLFDQLVLNQHQRSRLFYRQSMLFIRFLKRENPGAFEKVLASVLAGEKLSSVFDLHYKKSLSFFWREFLGTINVESQASQKFYLGERPRYAESNKDFSGVRCYASKVGAIKIETCKQTKTC